MKNISTFGVSSYATGDIALFRGIGGIAAVLSSCPILQFSTGETVPVSIDGTVLLYLVLQGQLKVSIGEESGCRVIGSGQCVGEVTVFNGERRGHGIKAEQVTDVLAIDPDTLWQLFDASAEFSRQFLLLPSLKAQALYVQTRLQKMQQGYSRQMSMIDAIAGLRNRDWFDENLPVLIADAQQLKKSFSMMMINLDYIVQFSDAYDYPAEEEAIQKFGNIMVSALRPTDFAARYNDSDLAIILPDTDLDGAVIVAQRFFDRLQKTVLFADMEEPLLYVPVSFGVTCLTEGQLAEDLIEETAAALHRAKNTGKGGVST